MSECEEGWVTVRRSKKTTKSDNNVRKSNMEAVENMAVSYYFTDIPETWKEIDLWKLFLRYGCVVDVYIAKKKSLEGKSFGFVRFIKVQDANKLEKHLNSIQSGDVKIRVNLAKFARKKPMVYPEFEKVDSKKGEPRYYTGVMDKTRSFANVVKRDRCSMAEERKLVGESQKMRNSEENVQASKVERKHIEISSGLTNNDWLNRALVGDLLSHEFMENVAVICEEEGLNAVSVKYIGGMKVLMIFETEKEANDVLSSGHQSVSRWINNIQRWDSNCETGQRLAWIYIQGLPLSVWCSTAYSKIASLWGKVIVPEECPIDSPQLVFGKVCFLTSQRPWINEVVDVSIDGKVCEIHVFEARDIPWRNKKLDMKSDSYSESESDFFAGLQKGGFSDSVSIGEDDSDDDSTSPQMGFRNHEDILENKEGDEQSTQFSVSKCDQKSSDTIKEGSMGPNSNFKAHGPILENVLLSHDVGPVTKDDNGLFMGTESLPMNEKVNRFNKEKPTKYKKVYSRHLKKKKLNETSKSSRMPSISELGVSDSESNPKRIHLRNQNLPLVAEDYDDSGSKEVSEEVNQTLVVGNSIGFSMKDASKEKASYAGDGFIVILGNWVGIDEDLVVVKVYAPQNPSEKQKLWDTLKIIRRNTIGHWLCFGDFNAIKDVSECKGMSLNPAISRAFDQFIFDAELIEVPLGGRNFTRITRDGKKMSRLDLVLVSPDILDFWPKIHVTALPRRYLDHSPLLLETNSEDFGPTPFKFYNVWLQHDSLDQIVVSTWNKASDHPRLDVSFCRKLKTLKVALKDWSRKLKESLHSEKSTLVRQLEDLDMKADRELLTESDFNTKNEELQQLNIPFKSFFSRKIGKGDSVFFWTDEWIGDLNLANMFPRLYALEIDKDCSLSERLIRLVKLSLGVGIGDGL
ncbi:RNA-directed DNA polymerase, eukaryota [Artemisia annua]|uniref:RNA-directed DNA polymerase, eukaryota n=1 Tax=Artemisia annua TaxID=35608 RepID=A0A2U1PHD2_ARTAN|nr:RNA-directed DNA polymerase, eukaryota [Artemisia annua]